MNEKADSLKSKDGCNYGTDCPLEPKVSVPYCCCTCAKTKAYHLSDTNRHLWTEERGFHSPDGCKLPRSEMPQECLVYDCRAYTFITIMKYFGGRWHIFEGMEMVGDEITAVKLAVNETLRHLHGKNNS